ncbi:hypothetical protein HPB51_004721 [Rhipicephalus microplus]|uniref:Uncharacterized protein n=1 Tax=Rhipicephalus microplus TaxID=6941 RepID=A0A9J6DZS4_RHIMP|nr:hypothetical protein HPB51_004721 [Rhipicephalus microplus]
MVCVLCQRLGWRHLQLLVSEFQARLHFGVQPELCPLLSLPSLDGPLARVVFDAGFLDPAALAQVVPEELDIILRNTGPFQGRGESRCWHLTAHGTVTTTQLANILVREARAVVEGSLGVAVAWANKANAAAGSAASKNSHTDNGDTENLQERETRNSHGGTHTINSLSNGLRQDASGNDVSTSAKNSVSPLRQLSPPAREAFISQRVSRTRKSDSDSPIVFSSPKQAVAFESEHKTHDDASETQSLIPWSSLQPGGTIAHLELEVHDSEDEERLTLDGLFGSLPVASQRSPLEARHACVDSPQSAKSFIESNLDDAILLWENNSSPLSLPTTERVSKEAQSPPAMTQPNVAPSPKDDDIYMLGESLIVNTQMLNVEKEIVPTPPKNSPPRKARVRSPKVQLSGKKSSAQKTSRTTRRTSPLTTSPNNRVLRSQTWRSRQNEENVRPSAHHQGASLMAESFGIGSSFFQATVPRTSKLKSPPLTLQKSMRVACWHDDQPSPAREKPLTTNTTTVEISAGVCSLGSSALSELFSSPGNAVVKSNSNSSYSERSEHSSKSSKGHKRSASEGELFSSTDDSSDHSLNSLADRVREEFSWKRVESVRDFLCQWEKQKEFAMALTVRSRVEVRPSIGPTKSARLVFKSCENPFACDNKCVTGVAVCWGKYEAHYLPLGAASTSARLQEVDPEIDSASIELQELVDRLTLELPERCREHDLSQHGPNWQFITASFLDAKRITFMYRLARGRLPIKFGPLTNVATKEHAPFEAVERTWSTFSPSVHYQPPFIER